MILDTSLNRKLALQKTVVTSESTSNEMILKSYIDKPEIHHSVSHDKIRYFIK